MQKIIDLNTNLENLRNNLIKTEPDFTAVNIEFNAVDWISGQIGSWKKKEAEVATNEGLVKQIATLALIIQNLKIKTIYISKTEYHCRDKTPPNTYPTQQSI